MHAHKNYGAFKRHFPCGLTRGWQHRTNKAIVSVRTIRYLIHKNIPFPFLLLAESTFQEVFVEYWKTHYMSGNALEALIGLVRNDVP